MARCSASEHQIQCAYFDWARRHPLARRAYAVPNGGHRHIAVAAKLKAEGVRAGVLDAHLPLARGGAHGLYLEFKSRTGRPTSAQAEEAQALVADGFAVALCRTPEGAIDLTTRYLAGEIGPALLAWN